MKKRSQVTNLKSTVNSTRASIRSHIPTSRTVAAVKMWVRKETRQFLTYPVIFCHNCVSSVSSNKAKLSLLKSYLTGYADQLFSHLTLEEANYEVAIKLLTEEFLDIPLIVDEIFKHLSQIRREFYQRETIFV